MSVWPCCHLGRVERPLGGADDLLDRPRGKGGRGVGTGGPSSLGSELLAQLPGLAQLPDAGRKPGRIVDTEYECVGAVPQELAAAAAGSGDDGSTQSHRL